MAWAKTVFAACIELHFDFDYLWSVRVACCHILHALDDNRNRAALAAGQDGMRRVELGKLAMLLAYTKRHKHKSHLPTTWFTHCMLQLQLQSAIVASWLMASCHIAHATLRCDVITNVRLSAFQLCAIYVGQPPGVGPEVGNGVWWFRHGCGCAPATFLFLFSLYSILLFCMCRHRPAVRLPCCLSWPLICSCLSAGLGGLQSSRRRTAVSHPLSGYFVYLFSSFFFGYTYPSHLRLFPVWRWSSLLMIHLAIRDIWHLI